MPRVTRHPVYELHAVATPACAEHDTDWFYPITEAATVQIADAKRVCAACPVRDACLDIAVRHGEYGIWGGTTESERRAIRLQVTGPTDQVAA